MRKLPRDQANDYSREAAEARRRAVTEETGASLHEVGAFSFDPAVLPGNMEGFSGVAQVPLGFAGPGLLRQGQGAAAGRDRRRDRALRRALAGRRGGVRPVGLEPRRAGQEPIGKDRLR
jgi:Hydroxymethylglutaryl-coenzyme A reductase